MQAIRRLTPAILVLCLVAPLPSGRALSEEPEDKEVFKKCLPDFSQFVGGEDWSELMCGPATAANAFHWLAVNRKLPGLLKDGEGDPYTGERAMIEDLAEQMVGNRDFKDFPGVSPRELLSGKYKFAKERGLDKKLVYYRSEWEVEYAFSGPSAYIKSATRPPNLGAAQTLLKQCETIELFIDKLEYYDGKWWRESGHIISLAGYNQTQYIINDPDSKKDFKAKPPEDHQKVQQKEYFGKQYTTVSEYWDLEDVTIGGVTFKALKGYGAEDEKWVIRAFTGQSPKRCKENPRGGPTARHKKSCQVTYDAAAGTLGFSDCTIDVLDADGSGVMDPAFASDPILGATIRLSEMTFSDGGEWGYYFTGGTLEVIGDGDVTFLTADIPWLFVNDDARGTFGDNIYGEFENLQAADGHGSAWLSAYMDYCDTHPEHAPEVRLCTDVDLQAMIAAAECGQTIATVDLSHCVPEPVTLAVLVGGALVLFRRAPVWRGLGGTLKRNDLPAVWADRGA